MRYIQDGATGTDEVETALANLRFCLQLLAASPHDQIAHYLRPDFPFKAEEMALDYYYTLASVREMIHSPEEQSDAVVALDQYLAELSGKQHAEFWTDDVPLDDPSWETVRAKAKATLSTFGWPAEVPPRQRYIEIP